MAPKFRARALTHNDHPQKTLNTRRNTNTEIVKIPKCELCSNILMQSHLTAICECLGLCWTNTQAQCRKQNTHKTNLNGCVVCCFSGLRRFGPLSEKSVTRQDPTPDGRKHGMATEPIPIIHMKNTPFGDTPHSDMYRYE